MPNIRVDNEVMEELKRRAVDEGLVFHTPNEVLRSVLALGPTPKGNQPEPPMPQHYVDVELGTIRARKEYHLIPVKKYARKFFPGCKLTFELHTDLGVVNTHVTSAPQGTMVGDPDQGHFIQKGLRDWYDGHPELRDEAVVRIESLQPHRVYRLSVVHPGGA